MTWAVFAAALASALLHAAWNVLAKMQPKPGDGVFGIVVACAGLCALALPFVGLPPISAWPWLLTAAFFNVLYWRALMAAYDRTGFATAYPVARAAIPPAAVLLGWMLLSEPPQSGALFGLAVVVAALLLFAASSRRLRPQDFAGLLFAAASGTALALAFVLDTAGIRLMRGGLIDFTCYCVTSSLVTALALTVTFAVERRNPLQVLIERPGPCHLGALPAAARLRLHGAVGLCAGTGRPGGDGARGQHPAGRPLGRVPARRAGRPHPMGRHGAGRGRRHAHQAVVTATGNRRHQGRIGNRA